MKTVHAKKKPGKSLAAALAGVEADLAVIVAAIAAERKATRSHTPPRRSRRVAAHAA